MSDHSTRLALWSIQGTRRCIYCGAKIYVSTNSGGHQSVEHVDQDIKGQAGAHMPAWHCVVIGERNRP